MSRRLMPAPTDIDIDYTLAMEAGLGDASGLRDEEIDGEAERFAETHAAVMRDISGRLGFWSLPDDQQALANVRQAAETFEGTVHVLVLGIGGSSLGARAVCEALGSVPGATRTRVHFVDNTDPWRLATLLSEIDPATTRVLAVSKSGGTLETTAQLLVVREWLDEALTGATRRDRIVAITDPEAGPLRALAMQERWPTLAIPPNVGGRFSVLTAAGLLPAAIAGVRIDDMLAGAREMAARCANPDLRENPAGMLAMLHVLHHRLRDRPIHVMMPYADRLRAFANWYVQLWAESLGKRKDAADRVVETGPTPVPAVGATDQHAQLQLFIEGPRDKLLTFVVVDDHERDLAIAPDATPAHLAGKTLGALLRTQHEATSEALAADRRPSITVRLARLDAHHVGGLLFLYEAATAFAGGLYGIDAFDQPGVELGKRLTDGLLGRQGYDDALTELAQTRAKRPRQYRV